jgi:hypothetical protein
MEKACKPFNRNVIEIHYLPNKPDASQMVICSAWSTHALVSAWTEVLKAISKISF